MKKAPLELDRITDIVLGYRPTERDKATKQRKTTEEASKKEVAVLTYISPFLIAAALCISLCVAIWFAVMQAIPDHYESAGQRQEVKG